MRKYKRVIFFSDEFGSSFVNTELELLSKYFESIIIVSSEPLALKVKPENVSIMELNFDSYSALKMFSANTFIISSILLKELFSTYKYFLHPNLFKIKISELFRCFYLANEVRDRIDIRSNGEILFYSFWFNKWATVLAILTKNGVISRNVVVRAHGTDLFEERVPILNKIAFRWFQIEHVAKVVSVSKNGATYLKEKYPLHKHKIFTSYLGTRYFGTNSFNEKGKFTIVSCAKIRNIKRIHLIPEILMHIDLPIRWIHIGDENLDSDDDTILIYKTGKKKLVGKSNVEFITKGNMDNLEVLDFYKNNSVNLFLSVSEYEGLPVSIMEAMSCGIPVMATNVGGCSEAVNEQTGILIPKDLDPKKVADMIVDFSNSQMNTFVSRKKIQEFWKNNFDAENNFESFITLVSA